MVVEVIDCEQGSEEWRACRLGIPTASEFSAILAEGRTRGSPSLTRRTYLYKLIAERMTGEPADDYTNRHMERGKEMEAEARDWYAFACDVEPRRVGFIRNGRVGCSPDSLIGENGMLEIKTKLGHLQVDVLLSKTLPSEHKAQVQGQLWVAEREWVDFISYWPKMPPFKLRVYRDEEYIKHIAKMVDIFCNELETVLAAVREAA